MIEFLIKRCDGQWFDFPPGSEPYRPLNIPFRNIQGFGDARIQVDECQISFSYEDPGIQISFEGQMDGERAVQVAENIRQCIEQVSGQRGELIQISF